MSLLIFTVLVGLLYPLVVTGIAQLVFPHQANGSLIVVNGKTVGSSLIGQDFTLPKYFWPRPSAPGAGYDPNSSSASNLGPTSKSYIEGIQARVASQTLENPGLRAGDVPVDMVTASASGLDPDISIANALDQAGRVARARHLPDREVLGLVHRYTASRQLGFLGEPTVVDVLELNLALDNLALERSR